MTCMIIALCLTYQIKTLLEMLLLLLFLDTVQEPADAQIVLCIIPRPYIISLCVVILIIICFFFVIELDLYKKGDVAWLVLVYPCFLCLQWPVLFVFSFCHPSHGIGLTFIAALTCHSSFRRIE